MLEDMQVGQKVGLSEQGSSGAWDEKENAWKMENGPGNEFRQCERTTEMLFITAGRKFALPKLS